MIRLGLSDSRGILPENNLRHLPDALTWCANNRIGCLQLEEARVGGELPNSTDLKKEIRLVLRLDQMDPSLESVNALADAIGADVIYLYAAEGSLDKLGKSIKRLSQGILSKLAFENDDTHHSPAELIPFCLDLGIPFVYNVHNHRCLPDKMGIEEATMEAIETWDREPLLRISSPKDGWASLDPKVHDDFVHIEDFPASWRSLGDVTIDVEANGREAAVLRLRDELAKEGVSLWPG